MKNKNLLFALSLCLFVLCLGLVSAVANCSEYSYATTTDGTDYFNVDNNASAPNTTVMTADQDFGSYTDFTPRTNFTANVSGTLTGGVVGQTVSLRWITPLNISPSFVLKNGSAIVSATNYTLTKNVDTWTINWTDARYNGTALTYYFNRTFVACKVGLVEGLTCDDLVMNASKVYSTATTADFITISEGSTYGDDASFYMNPASLGNFTQDQNWAVEWTYTERTCTAYTYGSGECTQSEHSLWLIVGLIVLAGLIMYMLSQFEGHFGVAQIVILVIIVLLVANLITILSASC